MKWRLLHRLSLHAKHSIESRIDDLLSLHLLELRRRLVGALVGLHRLALRTSVDIREVNVGFLKLVLQTLVLCELQLLLLGG